ncbi:MAG TPA: phasin family protein [Usitatibacter sp.]|nr:phasin family protein [Usitatibacter sp.]
MARRKGSRGTSRASADKTVRDSAQKIWLAGLGAFERARTEGPRMFDALVEQGRTMGARAAGAADQALKTMRGADYAGRFDKLEKLFEERVATSLKRLGVLTTGQVEDLARQVRELNDRLQAYGKPPRARKAAGKPGARRAKRKAGARKSMSRSRAKRSAA